MHLQALLAGKKHQAGNDNYLADKQLRPLSVEGEGHAQRADAKASVCSVHQHTLFLAKLSFINTKPRSPHARMEDGRC